MRLQQCLIRRSGTTLPASDAELLDQGLGELDQFPTLDGSFSLHSSLFCEAFHNSAGALNEARAKFVRPAEVQRFKPDHTLRVLDVCFGLGYNSAALWDSLSGQTSRMQWWGLEIDARPLRLALANTGFINHWTHSTFNRLRSLDQCSEWTDADGQGTLLFGDARQCLDNIPEEQSFDLIFHDAFSPQRCPQLWSEEFLKRLADRLAPEGRLLTYSRSAAVRTSLKRAGLELRSLLPAPGERQGWSSGTLAIKPPLLHAQSSGDGWRSLSQLELEHLKTRAAVPFRDPSGRDHAAEIIQRRHAEQRVCGLESTNSWQRRNGLNKPKNDRPSPLHT